MISIALDKRKSFFIKIEQKIRFLLLLNCIIVYNAIVFFMRVAIHQPNYLPWIGFFSKMSLCDVFVSFDSVDLPNRGINHRNKIRTKTGWDWLTIPLEKKYVGVPIRDVMLPEDTGWWKKHWIAIVANYSRSPFFAEYKSFFETLYAERKQKKLQELNESLILFLADCFDITPKFIHASDLDLDFSLQKTDFIVNILQKTGCTDYITGSGGSQTFLEPEKIQNAGIKIHYLRIDSVEYPQRFPGFEPYMSAIDVLFNLNAKNGKEYIDRISKVTTI